MEYKLLLPFVILFIIVAFFIILHALEDGGSISKGNIIAIMVAFIVLAYGFYYFNKQMAISQLKQQETKLAVSKMVGKYQAVSFNWSDFDDRNEIYVLDIQNALKVGDTHPVLLKAIVVDVVSTDSKYFVHFNDDKIRFILECNLAQVKSITQERNKESDYAVIALISSVQRKSVSNDAEDEEQFLASGSCLDLMPINY